VSGPETAVIYHLGRVAYRPAWALQEAIKDRHIQAKRSGEYLPHVMLLLEHPPVFTMGKSGNDQHLLAPGDAEVVYIDRGGDVTYHGPGQLVAYFLLDLDRLYRDLHRFMRDLEEIVLRTLNEFGLTGFRVPKRTGVWVGEEGTERKICAFGIHVSRWVTTHGLALNIDPDLQYFSRITPCGIADRGITSMVKELGKSCDTNAVARSISYHFDAVFGIQSQELSGAAAYKHLENLLDQKGMIQDLAQQPIMAVEK